MAERTDYDSPWKTIIEQHLADCLAFYFPTLHAAIDWTRDPIFREQELQQIVVDSDIGTRRVDKLVDVRLESGEQMWLLIHIEVQRRSESDFAERMFTYYYRIFEKFQCHPVSLAILTDRSRKWRPQRFEKAQFGCKLRLDFPIAKLVDYNEEALLASTNPFALVTLAQQLENRTANVDADKYATKLRLMRLLFEQGYEKSAIRNLFTFIDWILQLPAELEQHLQRQLAESSLENDMQYVSYLERTAEARGREEGREEGLEFAIQTVLESRLGNAPDELMEKVRQLDEAQLRDLLAFISVARTLDDVEAQLNSA